METSPGSTLKTYSVEPGEKRGTINVTCPQKECGFKFVCSRSWLKGHVSDEGRLYMSASCPHCYRTAWRSAR